MSYGDNRSIRAYLGEFLHVASLYTKSTLVEPVFEREGRELPLPVKYAIGRMLRSKERIPADWDAVLVDHPSGYKDSNAGQTGPSRSFEPSFDCVSRSGIRTD